MSFLDSYMITDFDDTGDPAYYGYVDLVGNWVISEHNEAAGTIRYAKGASGYATNWGNRKTTVVYDYFDALF